MYSIYSLSKTLIEGTEAAQMREWYPDAGDKNSNNVIFVGTHPTAVNPYIVGDLIDAEGEKLSGDALVLEVAKELAGEARERAIHLTKAEAVRLAKSPLWRLWTKDYGENRPAFEADYLAVKAQFPALPDYTESTTYQQAADWLLAGIKSI